MSNIAHGMTADQFLRVMGRPAELDDLERVNCPLAGRIGHLGCGWCKFCHTAKFQCKCARPHKPETYCAPPA